METTPYKVLFVCTGNSARSILAEVIMNTIGHERFIAYSAGSQPKGEVHPLALKVLAANRYHYEGVHSKSWTAFTGSQAPQLHFVFTLCDQAAGETCPSWPGQPITANWSVPDPAAEEGSAEVRERAFHDTLLVLTRRIQLLLALPLHGIDRATLQQQVNAIGRSQPA